MSAPPVSEATARLYGDLPEFYRTADDAQADYPLLRYLSLTGDLLGQVEELAERIDYIAPDEGGAPGGTSDLVDPDRADPAWLPWLTQLVGARYSDASSTAPGSTYGSGTYGSGTYGAYGTPDPDTAAAFTEAQRRAAIRSAAGGRFIGTRDAIVAAARTALIYSDEDAGGYVSITRDKTNPHLLHISTTPVETPSAAAVLAAIDDLGARPAGHLIDHSFYALSWATLEATYPTWAVLEANAPTWAQLESTQ